MLRVLTFLDDGLLRHLGLVHLLYSDLRLHRHYGAHVWSHYRLLLYVAEDGLDVLAGALYGLYLQLLLHHRLLDQLGLDLLQRDAERRETEVKEMLVGYQRVVKYDMTLQWHYCATLG